MREIKTIMLVDDNPDDNFFHSRVIKKMLPDAEIIIKEDGSEAYEYLSNGKRPLPDLILLDINMPIMNGWEFLENYTSLAAHLRAKVLVVMLTSSEHPDDIEESRKRGVVLDFKTKPLNNEILQRIISKHFGL